MWVYMVLKIGVLEKEIKVELETLKPGVGEDNWGKWRERICRDEDVFVEH